MTDLERFVKRLLETLKARHPAGAQRPFTVAELRAAILPYRMHRSALKLSSSEDYELLVLRVVAEEGGFSRTTPPDAAERAREEVASPVPDLDLLELLGETTIQLTPGVSDRIAATESAELAQVVVTPVESTIAAVAAVESAAARSDAVAESVEDPFPEDAAENESADRSPVEAPVPFEPLADSVSVDGVTATSSGKQTCGSCDALLPADRALAFCPFCGERVGVRRCRRCGSEMDAEWRYCGACGEAHVR